MQQRVVQYARASQPSALLVRDRTAGHKNSSLPWYHFTGVTSVALETARATRLTLPLCNIFSRMKMIDNLWALNRSSLSLSTVWR